MIWLGYMMDVMQLYALHMFWSELNSFRVVLMFPVFMWPRAMVMNSFLTGRPEGDVWHDPGFPAITIPYHEMNDFFWSGHVGTCILYMMEYFCHGETFMGHFALFVMVNEWIPMTLTKCHYIIDLYTGLLIGHWAYINAEWISYILDVKFAGYGKDKREYQHAHQVCDKCGWSNDKYRNRASEEELKFLDKTSRIRKRCIFESEK